MTKDIEDIQIGDTLVASRDVRLACMSNHGYSKETYAVNKNDILVCIDASLYYNNSGYQLRILLHPTGGVLQIAYNDKITKSPWRNTFELANIK